MSSFENCDIAPLVVDKRKVAHSSYFKKMTEVLAESGLKVITTKAATLTQHVTNFGSFGGVDLRNVLNPVSFQDSFSKVDWSKMWTARKADMCRMPIIILDSEMSLESSTAWSEWFASGSLIGPVEEAFSVAPLDTDTQWFVTPKDLKETSRGKTIGLQKDQYGWSCYEDD